MTVKKFRLYLAADVDKEEAWLTEMSANGLHFQKYRLGVYYFEEDPEVAYVYQTDFHRFHRNDAWEQYLQLYQDAGWESVSSNLGMYHYFRRDANLPGAEKIYSDKQSVKETYQRMLKFFIVIFLALFAITMVNIVAWRGYLLQEIAIVFDITVLLLYIYQFIAFRKKIRFYTREML